MNNYNKIYKIARKVVMARNAVGTLRCDRCPYHRKENAGRPVRNWKAYRLTQYKHG